MTPPIKHFVHQPGAPMMKEVDTSAQEAVTGTPRCNIWWFLLLVGGAIFCWLLGLSVKYLDISSQRDKIEGRSEEQFKHILYRLDELDKKLDKRVSSGKMADDLAGK